MKTKEERAEDFAFNRSLLSHHRYDRVSVIEGYIQGCKDQEPITRKEVIDKACDWLKSYRQDTPECYGYIAGIVNDKTIEDFRKAMKSNNK